MGKKRIKTVPLETSFQLRSIKPVTERQQEITDAYDAGKHLFIHGRAGTGKSFLAVFLALRDVLVRHVAKKIIIIRSARPSLDVGFMPGNLKEKLAYFEEPYEAIVNDLCEDSGAYTRLKNGKNIQFVSTSYLRGVTFEDAVVILDEAQNCSTIECHTIATRVGERCRFIVMGDIYQKDFMKGDVSGFECFGQVLSKMKSVATIELTSADVVRSGFCKEYLAACEAV